MWQEGGGDLGFFGEESTAWGWDPEASVERRKAG